MQQKINKTTLNKSNENINFLVKNFRYKAWVQKIVLKLEFIEKLKPSQISVLITGDEITKNLNKKYRNKNKTTDVLSFAERDIENNFVYNQGDYLGEIIINVEQIKRQSDNFKSEFVLLLVHGYLHLRGYDHDTLEKEKLMIQHTNKLIQKI